MPQLIELAKYQHAKTLRSHPRVMVAIGEDPHYCPICNFGKTVKRGNEPVLSSANGRRYCRKCGYSETDV